MHRPEQQSTTAIAPSGPDRSSTGSRGFWAERLGLDGLRYPIPRSATRVPHNLGALTLACFVILALSGLWIAQFYNPNPAAAHDSVLYIITRAPFGDIARSVHYWSAGAMVLCIVAHLSWVFWRGSYRRPRELTWLAGVILAGLVFLLVVTGSVLRYDQEGYEALAHFVTGGELAGPVGRFFTEGFVPGTPVLTRMFTFHTSLLPLAAAVVVALHLWLVRTLGINADREGSVSFSRHAPRVIGLGLLLFATVLALALVSPEGLGYRPVPGHEITKPFWPVLWIYALESLTGLWALIWAPLAVFAFLLAVPLLDRGDRDRPPRWLRGAGVALLALLVALGVWAAIAPARQHIGM